MGEEWDSKNAAIDTAMNNEIMENQQAYRDALGGAAAEIEAAKSQWQSAMDEVKKRAEAKAAEVEEAKAKTEAAAEGTKEAETKVGGVTGDKAMGSWSAEELGDMLGANNAQERTAKAAEESTRLQRETNKHLKKMESATTSASMTYGD